MLGAEDESRQHPPNVCVKDNHPLVECESGNCRGRVVADAGQRQQLVVGGGNLAVKLVTNHYRGIPKPQCPTRIPKAVPGSYDLGRSRRSQVARGGPLLHPRNPRRCDARDGRLL